MTMQAWNRRRVLTVLGRNVPAAIAGLIGSRAIDVRVAGAVVPPDPKFVQAAFEMQRRAVAAGDQSFGAVVVKDGRIIGEGPSRVNTNQDATAHAEMEAIRDASRTLGSRNLAGCVMYSTFKPCPMCETAAYWANVSQLFHGAGPHDGGAPTYGGC